MNTPANLRVRISADLADIKQGLGLLRGELAKVKSDAAKTLPDTRPFEAGLGRIKTLIGGLFAGVTAGALFKGVIQETGQAQGELAQLRAALKSTGEAAGLTEGALVGMADRLASATTHSTGEIIDAQTRLLSYSGIAANEFPRALQLAIDQSIRLGESLTQSAETVGKALEYPAEGVSALTKQGFRFTEEQKKLLKELEKTGRLAEAQAIVMGVMEESYRGAAEAARNTLPGALAALRNAFVELLDGNGGSGAPAVTRAINGVVDALRRPETKEAFLGLANDVLSLVASFAKWLAQDGITYIRAMAQAVGVLVRSLGALTVAVATLAAGALVASIRSATAGMGLLAGATNLATAATVRLRAALATVGGPVTLAIAALTAGIYLLYQRSTQATRAQELHNETLSENARLARDSRRAALEDAQAKRAQAIETLRAAQAVAAERQQRLQQAKEAQARAGGGRVGYRGGRGSYMRGGVVAAAGTAVLEADQAVENLQSMLDDWNKRVVDLRGGVLADLIEDTADAAVTGGARVAASNALLRDANERALKELERLYGEGRLSIKEYFAERERLQLRAIDLAIEQARAELAVADKLGPRRKLEEEIASLQRDRAEVGVRSAREQAKAEQDLAAQVADLKRQLGDVSDIAAVGEAERARVLREYEVLFRRLEAESGAAGEQMGQALVARLVARAQQDALSEAATKIGTALRSIETAVGAQVGAGTMGMGEGERQLEAARAKALADYRALRAAAVSALSAHAPGSPEHTAALAGLRELDTEIANVVASQDTWRQKTEDLAANSLGDALADLITGAKGFKEAFSDMVRSFVAGVARMIAQEVALRAVRGLFGSLFGSPGQQTPNGPVAIGTEVRHSGGVVGQGAVRRSVSPLLFGAAPRYHNGGIAGLAPDEVPAILRRDEEVLTRSDRRHRANGGLGGGRADSYRIEVINTAQPVKAGETTVSEQPDGTQLIRLVLHAVADDVANGGVIAAAGRGRFGWKDQV
ncbi:phage tail length tape measure family protein [Luteimonas sp. TWI662]|uniref:phage tail length tape measure family protein n=1 Tax=Luteimonas sp. TWI662 TaxID=3136789 RepID=UPI00320B1C17